MSKRLTAKEIKHDIREDEVRTFLTRIFETIQERPGLILAIVGGVVGLALLGSGAYAYLNSQREEANAKLAEAIEIYGAPVVEEGATPDDPEEPSFASAEARRARAREAFEEVRSGLGASEAGEVANVYLAEIALEEGDAAKAREIWESFLEKNEGHVLALSVRLNLIHLDRAEGRAEEVAERLRQELETVEKSMPEDVLLFELAQTLDQLDQDEEARITYQRILDEHPQSPYAARARQMTTSG
jgi:tetratricopeptide (TPR) repeat protein